MLTRLLNDTCTVTRSTYTLVGGEEVATETVVYTDIPCMYDRSTSTSNNDAAIFYDVTRLTVVLEADKVIQKGDIVTIEWSDYYTEDVRNVKNLLWTDNVTLLCKQI